MIGRSLALALALIVGAHIAAAAPFAAVFMAAPVLYLAANLRRGSA